MIDRIDKHIIDDISGIAQRLPSDTKILPNLKVIDKEFENVIWDTLKTKGIVSRYALSKDKFEHFEEIAFGENYTLVADRLQALKGISNKVILIWNADFEAVYIDFDIFADYWEFFFFPSSDDLYVISENLDWIIYIAHFECFYLGKGLKEN